MSERMVAMRIGELSERTGISARSLRYYEQQGLLTPHRAANGYRVYGEREVVKVTNIRDLLDSGLTVEDIRDSLERGCLDRPLSTLPACVGALQVATERLASLDRRITALQGLRDRLAAQVEETRAVLESIR